MWKRKGCRVKGLFSQWPISGWFHKRLEDVKQSVAEVPAHQVRQGDLTALVTDLTNRHKVRAPQLVEARISQLRSETTIEVNKRSHLAFEHGAGAKVDAIRLQVLVPYEGEQDLLRSMPASQIPLRSVEGRIAGDKIVFTYTYPTSEAHLFAKALDKIKFDGLQADVVTGYLEPINEVSHLFPSVDQRAD